MFDARCSSMSPEGKYACTKLAGHHFVGSFGCKQAFTGATWCGFCCEWECSIHNVNGHDAVPNAQELEKALANFGRRIE